MSVLCNKCNIEYSNQSNLNRHIRNVHKIQTNPASHDKSVWSYKCLENGCNNSFQQNKGLIAHLKETHNLKFDCDEIVVKDMNGMYLFVYFFYVYRTTSH
jgi:uncharacterized Zn-finger protein